MNILTCFFLDRKFCLLLAALILTPSAFAATCESLSTLKLPDTTITSAKTVAPGEFVLPGGSVAPPASVKNLPAFCRVTATLTPAKDSEIKVEVWMPLTGWNGRFRAEGNGGFAGQIMYPSMAVAMAQGYATASTDTGHSGSPIEATWAKGHPDRIVDFGWRAIHEMTVKSKAIIQAFYGEAAKKAYFAACSNGGRQGLMEAQRFPEDYDGILAGAPANYWTPVFAAFIWNQQATQGDAYITTNKVPAIANAVLAACDANDEVKDGVLNDPRECHFDPSVLLCKQGDSDSCLTAPQVAALKKIYSGPVDSKGKQMFPGFLPGGEEGPGGWTTWFSMGPGKDWQGLFASGFFTNMITADQPVDLKTINVETAVQMANEQQGKTFNATDPNLKAFMDHGGKLIVYHGWSDAALPPMGSVEYFESVQTALGAKETDSFMRLYMVPGMHHCAGGPGATNFGEIAPSGDAQHDIRLALEQWVEKGVEPDRIIATKYAGQDRSKVEFTRPLCAYPESAAYKGEGDTTDAASFECALWSGDKAQPSDPTVKLPRAVHAPKPVFTDSASRPGVQGTVEVSLLVGTDGKPYNIKIVRSLDPGLDAASIESAKALRFSPATKDGKPVAMRMRMTMEIASH